MTPEIGTPLIVLLMLALAFVIWRRRQAAKPVKDGPEDELYRVFTREFDNVLAVTDLPAALRSLSPDFDKGYLQKSDFDWDAQVERSADLYREVGDIAPRDPSDADELQGTAILLLVDQSGSMRGERMAWVTAGVRRLAENLERRGANVAIAGYTTAGWHGGFAKKKWIDAGRPDRPGRLCALLHIVYQPFDGSSFAETGWRNMLNPDILRENVDGESLLWGAEYLRTRSEPRRILVVVSDGAPVDDSTLMVNGPSYMHRHFLAERDALIEARDLELLAIGADHRVDEFYPVSRPAQDAGELVAAGLELVMGK
jgi:cobaltochelatase CobT